MNDAAGVPRWPAAFVELLFNALLFGAAVVMRWRKVLPGQQFHVYLMAYGTFRFLHEFLRDTPEILGPISGYQVASLGIVALGVIGFWRRRVGEIGLNANLEFVGSRVEAGE
jgi:phosphatidylglycerol:prolipoprotein diacylglycerol transferase